MALFYILAVTTRLYMFTTIHRTVHLEGWTFLHVYLNFHSFSSEFIPHFFLNLPWFDWVPLLRSVLGRWGPEKMEGYRYRRDVPILPISTPRPKAFFLGADHFNIWSMLGYKGPAFIPQFETILWDFLNFRTSRGCRLRHLLKLLSHPTSHFLPQIPLPIWGSQEPSLINFLYLDLDHLVP